MNILAGTNIYASGGLAGNNKLRRNRKFPCYNYLLHIAAGKILAKLVSAGGLDLVLSDQIFGKCLCLIPANDPAVQNRFLIATVDHDIISNRAAQRQSLGHSLLRDKRQPFFNAGINRCLCYIGAADFHAALHSTADTENALGKFGLTIALHAGNAEDLTAAQFERKPIDLGFISVADYGKVFHLKDRLAQRNLLTLHACKLAPDHHLRQLLRCNIVLIDRSHCFAGTQHSDAVRDRHDLL